ncbi:MAG: N-acetylmuramoyl-L-alanine amidase [Frankiales bacterium]|nr:N-acetylmuramoyl-L-alanine amidase [Frankiales bacterium]
MGTVHAKRSDGHTTVIPPVDRTRRPLSGGSAPGVSGQALRARALSPTKLSNWHVIYDAGFNANIPARDAFDRAVDTWAHAVASPVTITVKATLQPFATDPTLLGEAGPTSFYCSAQPGQPCDPSFPYFPVAESNALFGVDHDPGSATLGDDDPDHTDIEATFSNDDAAFYYSADPSGIASAVCTPVASPDDPNPTPTAGACVDFQSVVLHELGHGLGFLGSVAEDPGGTTASYGYDPHASTPDDRPYVFDFLTGTSDGTGILDYPNGSTELHDAITSNGLYWFGPEGAAADRGREPQLWAPTTYASGTTYSHLDDEAYPQGDPDSLMTPYAEGGDVTRDPGEVTLGMLRDMGWTTPAPPGARYTPVPAARLLDTGATRVPNGGERDISLASRVPASATAVVVNLTTSQPSSTSTVRAYPTPRFDGAPIPSASNLITYARDDRSDLATVPISGGGPPGRAQKIRVRNEGGAARLLVDIVGYYAPTGQLYFHPMTQRRLADSRTGTGLAKRRLGQGQIEDLVVAGAGGVPSTAVAAVLTVTAIRPSVHTYVTAYTPGGSTVGWTVNLNAGAVEANQAIVKLLNGKVRFRNYLGTTDLVAEVAGWYDTNPSGGTAYRNVLPQRLLTGAAKLGAAGTKVVNVGDGNDTYGVPTTARAVVVNVQGIAPTVATYFSAYYTGSPVPTNSVLSLAPGRSAGAMATIPLGGGANAGSFTLRNSAGAVAYAVDVQGWFGTP